MNNLTLGKVTEYIHQYTPELLQGVPRALNRNEIGLNDNNLPFQGVDIWNGYEISWLNKKGKPEVAMAQFIVPFDSPNLIESKSFKLYLNSFNQSNFASFAEVEQLMRQDLTACAGNIVEVKLYPVQQLLNVEAISGVCLDDLDIEVEQYDLQPEALKLKNSEIVTEKLHSNLLKSNCLITNQPDWASVIIEYSGKQIDHESLLKYLISFRQHNEFHEQCVERIFTDIMSRCEPEKLSVYARYTRRGGLDINPYRSNYQAEISNSRFNRQ